MLNLAYTVNTQIAYAEFRAIPEFGEAIRAFVAKSRRLRGVGRRDDELVPPTVDTGVLQRRWRRPSSHLALLMIIR